MQQTLEERCALTAPITQMMNLSTTGKGQIPIELEQSAVIPDL